MATYSSKKYPSGSVTSAQLADGTVVAVDLADGAITSAKLNSTVDLSGKTVTYRSIVAGDIASDAITTAKITDANITSGKLASGAAVANIGARAITAAQVPAGSVLQVVNTNTYSPQTMSITSSSTLVASGFTCSITPTSATSKILIMYTSTVGSTSSNSGVAGVVQMYRNIGGGSYGYIGGSYNNYWNTTATYIAYQQLSFTILYLDSPGTTSQVIYQPYFNFSCGTAGGQGVLGGRNNDGLQYSGSHMIAMEIAV